MKIQPHGTPPNTSTPHKTTSRRTDEAAVKSTAVPTNAADLAARSFEADESAGRSFASLLDDASPPPSKKDKTDTTNREDSSNEDEAFDLTRSAHSEANTKARRHNEQEKDSTGNEHLGSNNFERQLNNSNGVPEANRNEATAVAPNARLILHIADLERIVASVRMQTLADRREITISLNRSTLEGLQVKLSSDKAGRISAEFIAASEATRAQLDARTEDLSNLLRARGVDLAELKTSIGTATSSGNGDDKGRDSQTKDFAERELKDLSGATNTASRKDEADARLDNAMTNTNYNA